MKRTGTTAVVIAALAMALALTADAEMRGRGGRHGRRGGGRHGGFNVMMLVRNPEVAEEVGITDDELEQIKDMAYESRKEQIALKSKLELARLEERYLVEQDNPDLEAVLEAVEKKGQVETSIAKSRITHELEIRALLGTERIEDLKKACREKRRERHPKRRGRKGSKRTEHVEPEGEQLAWADDFEDFPPFEEFEEIEE